MAAWLTKKMDRSIFSKSTLVSFATDIGFRFVFVGAIFREKYISYFILSTDESTGRLHLRYKFFLPSSRAVTVTQDAVRILLGVATTL